MIEIAIYIYLGMSAFTLLGTFFWLLTEYIDGIDNYWDWLIYGIFWIIQPIKSIIKLFKNI